MSRRIALPGADELFRSTGDGARPSDGRPAPSGRDSDIAGASAPDRQPAGASERRDERAEQPVNEPPVRQAAPRQARSAAVPAAAYEVEAQLAPVLASDTEGLEEAASAVRATTRRRPRAIAERRPSGRERHDEKITVYVSADELMDLEHARLALRGDHGLPVDRGRVVREALAVVLADFEAKGEASILVRRLRGR